MSSGWCGCFFLPNDEKRKASQVRNAMISVLLIAVLVLILSVALYVKVSGNVCCMRDNNCYASTPMGISSCNTECGGEECFQAESRNVTMVLANMILWGIVFLWGVIIVYWTQGKDKVFTKKQAFISFVVLAAAFVFNIIVSSLILDIGRNASASNLKTSAIITGVVGLVASFFVTYTVVLVLINIYSWLKEGQRATVYKKITGKDLDLEKQPPTQELTAHRYTKTHYMRGY